MNEPVKTPRHFESLYPPNSFEKEIEKIFHYVKNGDSCQVVGVPGTGRSNLLGLLPFNRPVRIKNVGKDQTKYHFVLYNFSEIRKKPRIELLKFLLVGLVDSLRERQMLNEYKEATESLNKALSTGEEIVIFQELKKLVDFFCLDEEMTIIFLFDRFEEYVPSVSQEFFTDLYSLRKRAKFRFSVVFSLGRPIEDVLEPLTLSDFHEFLEENIIYLPIRNQAVLDFRISYFEKINKVKVSQKVLDEILKLSGGHGKLTRLCLEAYFSVPNIERDLKSFLLSKQRVRGVLKEIWNFLTPSEQNAIKINGENEFLEKIGLIKDGESTIPLLVDFANEQNETIQEKISEEEIIYDSEKNEILKGDIILSDQLTSLEFKLLKFFFQNPSSILERDLLISAVWGDLASTQGVTDQALDQLIFRLRKKIEEDPNNPTHIQTIKGRGIKFIP